MGVAMGPMLAAGMLMMAVPAMAAPEPACPPVPAPLPAAFAGWARPIKLAAGGSIVPGIAGDVALIPEASVHYAARPGKTGDAAGLGATIDLAIARAGPYRVALGTGAWVDVVRGGKALASVAHDHGPACSGVRKIVDFQLSPGHYVIQLSATAAPVVRVMVIAAP